MRAGGLAPIQGLRVVQRLVRAHFGACFTQSAGNRGQFFQDARRNFLAVRARRRHFVGLNRLVLLLCFLADNLKQGFQFVSAEGAYALTKQRPNLPWMASAAD